MTFRILTETGYRILLENGSDFLRSETAAIPFAGFKMTGPDCCCCRDIVCVGGSFKRLNGDTLETQRNIGTGYTGVTVCDIDYENKLALMSAFDGTEHSLIIRDVELPATTTVLRSGSVQPFRGTFDRVNRRVFYWAYNEDADSLLKLWRINYDGTGDTLLCTLNVGATVHGQALNFVPAMIYCRLNEKIYYSFWAQEVGTANDKQSIRQVAADGTGDTLIFECANQAEQFNSANADQIYHWDIDHTNERILFTELSLGGGAFYGNPPHKWRLREMALDGTGVNTILETTQPVGSTDYTLMQYNSVQWSHKDNRIYAWERSIIGLATADVTGGFVSYDSSGTGRDVIAPRRLNTDDGTLSHHWLWCGFEKTGTGTEA